MSNTKCVADELFNKPFSQQKQNGLFFYCLLNKIARAIIKAIFMIVTNTNPKNSK